jgi:hypothetical protein
MESGSLQGTNIVRFPSRQGSTTYRGDQRSLMDAVYNAGSLLLEAGDRQAKSLATRLAIFGFVSIDELRPDGSPRRLRASEAFAGSCAYPWRVSKPGSIERLRA